ncbi:MAG: hypothetical protein IJ367_02085, partial [Clostridia bacterium]|nr:hypothetical protein [Clostridia bacterium]
MKLRVKEQWICYLLVAVLLVMGMRADIAPVNPSFLRGQNATMEVTAYSVIRSGSYIVDASDECNIDMIERAASTYQNSRFKRNLVKRFLRVAIAMLVVERFLLQRFYLETATDYIGMEARSSHIATVRYIHQ